MADSFELDARASLAAMRARSIARRDELWREAEGKGVTALEAVGWLIVLASFGGAIARFGWDIVTLLVPLLLAVAFASGMSMRHNRALLRIVKELDAEVQELRGGVAESDSAA